MTTYRFTKSGFLSGLQCHKKLWRETHSPELRDKTSPAIIERLEVGRQVGLLARQEYASGVLVPSMDVESSLDLTRQLRGSNTPCIFEAAFVFDGVYVRTDIFERNPDGGWDLIEVKSSTSVKDEHLFDAAVQYYCVVGSGLHIDHVFVKHVNNQCVFPNLKDFFEAVDVTSEVIKLQPEIQRRIAELKRVVDAPVEPTILIGKHCEEPHECQFKDDCWSHVPEVSIFTIPRLSWDRKNDLIEKHILSIEQVPSGYKMSAAQRSFVDRTNSNQSVIDQDAISMKLSRLTYPLYFLDFETINPAIPRFIGCRPYQQIPFQYSCHILDDNGEVRHVEYLHSSADDPRRPLAEQLITHLGGNGHIISYNAQFEKMVIKALTEYFPDLSTELSSLLPRFWDQLEIFKSDYFHPKFGGSNSIKRVLPVIAPDLSYDQLDEVHDGTEAGLTWNKALNETDQVTRERMFENLRAYCSLDTLAMVRIHEHLTSLG